jgi:hypothetical protein
MSITIVGMGMGVARHADGRRPGGVVGPYRRRRAALLSSLDVVPAEKHAASISRDLRAIRTVSGSIGLRFNERRHGFTARKKLLEKLRPAEGRRLPGISSVQYFAARLKRPWRTEARQRPRESGRRARTVRVHGETFF